MSIFKSLLVVALLVAVASAGMNTRRGRGRTLAGGGTHRQRGREFDAVVADAAAAPETFENNAVITDAIDAAVGEAQAFAAPETLSVPEAAAAAEAVQDSIVEALTVAAEQPQFAEVEPEVAAEKATFAYDELSKFLFAARRHQKALKKFGTEMSFEEAAEHHKGLQKYLEKAFFFANQFNFAVQQGGGVIIEPAEPYKLEPPTLGGGNAGRRMHKSGRYLWGFDGI